MKKISRILVFILISIFLFSFSACKEQAHIHEFVARYDETNSYFVLTCECGQEDIHNHGLRRKIITEPTVFAKGLSTLTCPYKCGFEVEQEVEFDYRFLQSENGEVIATETTREYDNPNYKEYDNPYYKIEAVPADGYAFAYWEVLDLTTLDRKIEYLPNVLVPELHIVTEGKYEYKPVFFNVTEQKDVYQINEYEVKVYIDDELQAQIPDFLICNTYHIKGKSTYGIFIDDKNYTWIGFRSVLTNDNYTGDVIISGDLSYSFSGQWQPHLNGFIGDVVELNIYLKKNN